MIGYDLDGTLVNTAAANRAAYTRIGLGDQYRCGKSLSEWCGVTDPDTIADIKDRKARAYLECLDMTTLTQTGRRLRDSSTPLLIVTCASYANAASVLRYHRFAVGTILCAPTRMRKIEIVRDLSLTGFVDDDAFVRSMVRSVGITAYSPQE